MVDIFKYWSERMTGFLSPTQLKRLKEHKYKCENTSVLDPYMQVFWNSSIEHIPRWMAPNTLTILGLAINIFTSLLLIFYSPDARSEAPSWVYVLCAIGLFVYQTLDALDGKQARRTGTSSPLGELFDHGCDSVSTVFVTLACCVSLQLGRQPEVLFAVMMFSLFLFYQAHWTTYVCGYLRFGYIDVTETQVAAVGMYLASAVFGSVVWEAHIPVVGVPLWVLPVVFVFLGGGIASRSMINVIFTGGVGKNKSTVADTSVLFPLIPILTTIIPAYIIYKKSPSALFENHPCLYIIAFGLVSSKITNRLVVAHMTKSELDMWDSSLRGPAMLFLNQYFNTPLSEYTVLWFCVLYCLFDLVQYSTRVCQQICSYLNIYCFSIEMPAKAPAPEPSDPKRPITRLYSRSRENLE
ncbi:PREDICTED: cholinephosphotransferase 1-like [Priapulus caudatus]|uniref:Cholinephosphotransferase 1-like n=1 Tax=Priapulus caudatus TaxID=37621 RepID=A0ABM1ERP3_PRICU|nr:PREDICTED: cholinephosphotransferase 1-like [Priapulus caudatus]